MVGKKAKKFIHYTIYDGLLLPTLQ